MTTLQELEKLRKQKYERNNQKKIDEEAKKIKEELESDTLKGQFKFIGKKFIKDLLGK